MSDPYYRVIPLFYYGEPEPFGTYDKETQELVITDPRAIGDLEEAWLKEWLAENTSTDTLEAKATFGVPLKAWLLKTEIARRSERKMPRFP